VRYLERRQVCIPHATGIGWAGEAGVRIARMVDVTGLAMVDTLRPFNSA
jgi:hypothetical protein